MCPCPRSPLSPRRRPDTHRGRRAAGTPRAGSGSALRGRISARACWGPPLARIGERSSVRRTSAGGGRRQSVVQIVRGRFVPSLRKCGSAPRFQCRQIDLVQLPVSAELAEFGDARVRHKAVNSGNEHSRRNAGTRSGAWLRNRDRRPLTVITQLPDSSSSSAVQYPMRRPSDVARSISK